jgi:hypothetical protein
MNLLARADSIIAVLREQGETERADNLAESVRKIREALDEDVVVGAQS